MFPWATIARPFWLPPTGPLNLTLMWSLSLPRAVHLTFPRTLPRPFPMFATSGRSSRASTFPTIKKKWNYVYQIICKTNPADSLRRDCRSSWPSIKVSVIRWYSSMVWASRLSDFSGRVNFPVLPCVIISCSFSFKCASSRSRISVFGFWKTPNLTTCSSSFLGVYLKWDASSRWRRWWQLALTSAIIWFASHHPTANRLINGRHFSLTIAFLFYCKIN